MTSHSKGSRRAVCALMFLVTACARDRPLVEQFQQGEWQPAQSRIVSLAGGRDGTHLSFSLHLEGEVHLLVEGTLEIDPQARLASGWWQEESGSRARSGPVSATTIAFFGGQGGRPSIGGQFTLSEAGAPLYRVNLPTSPLETSAEPHGQMTSGAPTGIAHPANADIYGHWMTKDPGDWPRITMINQIEYADTQHPSAACGFLLDTGDEILAATAKHVLIYFKSETMDSVSFRAALNTWRMFPKDSPGDVVVIDRLINEDPREPLKDIPSSRDWLLFTLREVTDGVQPLRLRSTPLEPGEKVHVIGWRYTDEGPQRVHGGRFVRIEQGSVLVSIDALRDNTIPGLSGSPVIDAEGYVIGLMSTRSGKLQRLAPAGYARDVIEKRRRKANRE